MLFVSRGYFESDSVREPECFSHLQDILEMFLGHQVAISFGYVFAIFGLLNGEAFRKLIAHGVCHLYSSALSDSVGERKCFSCLEDTWKAIL